MTLRKPNIMPTLPTMRPVLILLLILLMLLQLILREAPQDSTANRAKEPMTSFMAAKPACETARDGATDAAVAVGGLFGVWGILVP